MASNARGWLIVVAVAGWMLVLAACSSSHLQPPEVQGTVALVDDAGKPRLWVLSKQKEVRTVGEKGARVNYCLKQISTLAP